MRALVTGGEGFSGSHLVEYLLEQGQEVVVLACPDASLANLEPALRRLRLERADVRDGVRVLEVLRQTKPQRIYHLAAQASLAKSYAAPEETYDVNFGGTLNLLRAWRKLEIDCRFLLVSSSDVYGFPSEARLPLHEDTPMRPVSPYAGSKAAAELLALQFFNGYRLPIVRVRPFNHTGPRQSEAFVCSSLARQMAEIELGLRAPTIHAGNLQVRRDFSDVRDVVRGYHLLLEKGEAGDVYHLCSGRAVSIEEIVQTLNPCASKAVQVVSEPSRRREHEVLALWGDASKARETVGWETSYDLATTLRDLKLHWQRILRPKAAKAE